MDKIPILALIFLLLLFSANRAQAYSSYSLRKESTIQPSLAVVLESGTAGTSEISVNGTTANVTIAAITSIEDYVDNNTTDVDSSDDKGTHSNFSAQKYGPDSVYDNLTEEDTGLATTETLRPNSGGTYQDWNLTDTTHYGATSDQNDSTYIYANATEKYDTENLDDPTFPDTATINWVQIWVRAIDTGGEGEIKIVEGQDTYERTTGAIQVTSSWGNYSTAQQATAPDGGSWTKAKATALQAGAISDTIITELRVSEIWTVVNYTPQNYNLDLEVQWTNVDYNETNEYACIRTGTLGSESLKVDAWNGSGWETLTSALQPNQWNNISVSDCLTDSNFTIRFKGGSESDDATQDNWNIDATLLHVWTNGSTYDYALKVVSKKAYHQNIRLILYDNSSIGRLSNCTVWFYNATASSVQAKIIDGLNVQSAGDWFNLTASGDRPIAVYAEESSSGTSILYLRLEAVKGNSIVYTCLIKVTVN